MTTKIAKKNGILCWHFLPADGRTANGEGIEVVAGQTLKIKGPIELCATGYHASINALDALNYAPGMMVQRCVLWGETEHGNDKLVASRRTCLWVADATNAIVEFACWCAEQAFDEIRKLGIEPDQRSINAVNVARLWTQGKATKEELNAAADAAADAARAAYAARAAARAAYAADAAARAEVRSKQNAKLEELLLALEPAKVATG